MEELKKPVRRLEESGASKHVINLPAATTGAAACSMAEQVLVGSPESSFTTTSVRRTGLSFPLTHSHSQSDSMVEIKRTDLASSPSVEEDKYRLVYSKSKVYVHPTAYARDNIPGFVALVKRVLR